MRHIILGTAGHIDHGKSALVKALTGTDPDRLKEEKQRGITIDIGFADITYSDSGLTVGIVDVPGHERLVRNMLAGAGGIDMVMLVIAADEGIMPQSREHLSICNLLKIKTGLVAITKSDLVEKDWLDLVEDEVRGFIAGSFLEGSPIIPVSSKTGDNLEYLKKVIEKIALGITPKTADGLFRLPIDRVFTLKGFGTVVTGTALAGKISLEDPVTILPSQIRSKVRGLHSHGKQIRTAYAGQRVAINLQAVEKEDLRRGDVAVTSPNFSHTKIIDAFLELLPEAPVLKNKSLVHFYSGTSETVARVVLQTVDEVAGGGQDYCQLRLQDPVIVMAGDRYIIRRFSPLETLGGGEILDPSPPRRRRKDARRELEILHAGSIDEKIELKVENQGKKGFSIGLIEVWISAEPKKISDAVKRLEASGKILRYEDRLLHGDALSKIRMEILEILSGFHKNNPLKPGIAKEEVRNNLQIEAGLFNFVLQEWDRVIVERDLLRLADFKVALSSSEETLKKDILEVLSESRFQPPLKEELKARLKIDQRRMADILGLMVKEGSIVRINDSIYISGSAFSEIMSLLKSFFSGRSEMSVSEFRDLLNTSRKYALPILEYLDSSKVTMRVGDVRKLIPKN